MPPQRGALSLAWSFMAVSPRAFDFGSPDPKRAPANSGRRAPARPLPTAAPLPLPHSFWSKTRPCAVVTANDAAAVVAGPGCERVRRCARRTSTASAPDTLPGKSPLRTTERRTASLPVYSGMHRLSGYATVRSVREEMRRQPDGALERRAAWEVRRRGGREER